MSCVPLVLCAVTVYVLWQPMTKADNAMLEDMYYSANGSAESGSTFCADILVEVRGLGTDAYWRSTDQNMIVDISQAIHRIIRENGSCQPYGKTEYDYTVTFTDRQGGQTVYLLSGGQLTVQETGEVYAVSDALMQAFNKALENLKEE